MKRLLVAGVSALMLSACGSGGGGSVVGANSTDSTEITAVGTIVGNVNSNASSNASADVSTADNSTTVAAPATTDNAAITQGATSTDTVDAAAASNDSGP